MGVSADQQQSVGEVGWPDPPLEPTLADMMKILERPGITDPVSVGMLFEERQVDVMVNQNQSF